MKADLDIREGKLKIIVSQKEIEKLEVLKKELLNELNMHVIHERETIDFEISSHLTLAAKKNELSNLRYHIINDLDYNDVYKNVIFTNKNGFLEFVDGDPFLLFANAYNILDSTDKAIRVLQNIVRVHLLEWMYDNDYLTDFKIKFAIPEKSTQLHQKFNKKIFQTPVDQEFFIFCIQKTKNVNRRFLSILYGYMKGNGMFRITNQIDFAKYWNDNYKRPLIKIKARSAGFDTMEWNSDEYVKISSLKIDFTKQNS